jgi:tetratricopeptide (TPR) repeat protein
MPDHPGALIERGFLSVAGGRIVANNAMTTEIRASLVKLTVEGAKPLAEQTRGVSRLQVALANLAIAQVDFALRDMPAAQNDIRAASAVGADEQQFGEEAIDTLLMIGDLQHAKASSMVALANWPGSRRARISQAQVSIALGKPAEAVDILTRNPDAASMPRGQAVRGWAKLALGDVEGAKADFDLALKKLPKLELAVVGRTWVDLAEGELDDARKRVEPTFNPNTASVALTTVYAEVLRTSNDPAQREKARGLLEKLTANAPSTPEFGRALLEYGRVLRDLGDLRAARAAYADSIKNLIPEARLEMAMLLIEDQDPLGGRDMMESILKDAGPMPPANLLLEGARARMLAGDHVGAVALLDQADKAPNVVRWQYDRERGRLALRRNDLPGAAQALVRALDDCGSDPETFLLAADTVTGDTKQIALSGKLKALASVRLKDVPELYVVNGKLALIAENEAEAEKAYQAAITAFVKTTPRRAAQAHFGLAALFYLKNDYPNAQARLAVAMPSDPSLYAAYLFSAEVELAISGPKAQNKALELAKKSVVLNPDYVDGWVQVGTYGATLGKKKDLEEAITRVGALAPSSEALKNLQALRK